MIKRIALINPNFLLRDKFDFAVTYPLGLAYIAAILEKDGFEVKIIDANALNISCNQTIKKLLDIMPDIAGISCNFSPLHYPTLEIARLIKEELDIPVVTGGNHICALKEFFINNKDIDFVIDGEAEYVFSNLIRTLNSNNDLRGVNGLLFKRGEEIIETEKPPPIDNLDLLPLPAYHLLPMDLYARYSLITSRGCPFNCSFCASKLIFGKGLRFRSPEKVLSEIEHLIKNYGEKVVWFCDDTFTADEDYVLNLCGLINRRKVNFRWRCHTHITRISDRMLQEMKDAGCFCIVFGVESGSQKILKRMHKAMTKNQIINAIRKTKSAGIDAAAFFMVGMPGEDLETIMDSYRIIYASSPSSVSFCIALPLPGTELFQSLLGQNLISIDDLKWDYFFARIPGHREEEHYAASLASRWSGIPAEVLTRSCILGDSIPHMNIKLDESELLKTLEKGYTQR